MYLSSGRDIIVIQSGYKLNSIDKDKRLLKGELAGSVRRHL